MLRLMSKYPDEFPDLDPSLLEELADEYEASLVDGASISSDGKDETDQQDVESDPEVADGSTGDTSDDE